MVDEFSRFAFAIPCADTTTATVIKCLCSIFSVFGNPGYVHNDRDTSFLSKELKDWLHSKNIATSRTCAYNPRGNGQCERYNATIWRAIVLACKSRNIDTKFWESVLPDALHSLRSLLCTATNCTPHERMFNFARRSSNGSSIPTWLSNQGPVFRKRHVRNSKYDSMVDEVELIEVNPNYAHIRYPNGTEDTVSLRDLAPIGTASPCTAAGENSDIPHQIDPVEPERLQPVIEQPNAVTEPVFQSHTPSSHEIPLVENNGPELRRSSRVSIPPARLISEL